MNERIKELRKALCLTQQEFADRIGVKRNTVAQYEIGRNEPIDSVFSLICREFNVNEEWLCNGEGEMFNQLSKSEELSRFFGEVSFGSDDFKRRFITALARLDERQWEVLEKIALDISLEIKKTDP